MYKSKWGKYYVCPKCNNVEKPSFGNPWFLDEVCDVCGYDIDKDRYTKHKNMHTMRFVSDSVWYKPSTWGSCYYEFLEKDNHNEE